MGVTVETLYEAWERELAQLRHEPDVALIAALEWRARELGFDLVELSNNLIATANRELLGAITPPPGGEGVDWEGMATDEEDGITEEDLEGLPYGDDLTPETAAGLVAFSGFIESLHPRGRDGKWIKKFGLVRLLGGKDQSGKDLNGQRGQVTDILADKKDPGRPTIRVKLKRDGSSVDVKPNVVEVAPEKARIDKPNASTNFDAARAQRFAPRNSTITPDQSKVWAAQMEQGQKITVDNVDTDDVIMHFLDSTGPVDLTLMSQFSAMRGVGRPRSEMPQVPKQYIDDFKASLDAEGVTYEALFVDPRTLTATQAELDGKSVAELIASTRAGTYDPVNKPVWISSDNKVLDGHHRWAAATALAYDSNNVQFPVIRVDMPMDELLDFADEFNAEHGVAHREIGEVQERTYAPPLSVEPFIEKVAQARDRTRIAVEQRAKLTAAINARAAELSTTDAAQRYAEIDKMFVEMELRSSMIDTDQVHDKLWSGRNYDKWTPERSVIHEKMWDEFLAEVEQRGIPREHDALALGGLPGAGKSSSLKPGEAGDYFGVVAWEPNENDPVNPTHVSVNPDIIKGMLLRRGLTPPGLEGLTPWEQANFIHEESSALGKIFSARLSELGYNMILDNTMDSAKSMTSRMGPLAEENYRFRAMFADIPVDESKASARERYIREAFTEMGGRFVPSSLQGNAGPKTNNGRMSKNREAFDELMGLDWFTEWFTIDNTGISAQNPKKKVTSRGTGHGSAVARYQAAIAAAEAGQAPEWPPAPTSPPVLYVPPAPDVPPVVPGEAPVAPSGEAPAAPSAPVVV